MQISKCLTLSQMLSPNLIPFPYVCWWCLVPFPLDLPEFTLPCGRLKHAQVPGRFSPFLPEGFVCHPRKFLDHMRGSLKMLGVYILEQPSIRKGFRQDNYEMCSTWFLTGYPVLLSFSCALLNAPLILVSFPCLTSFLLHWCFLKFLPNKLPSLNFIICLWSSQKLQRQCPTTV